MNLNLPLNQYTYIAFDTETSGAYPVGYDIVEFGAIKYHHGQEIGKLQFLLKPREKMSDFIIGIHGITNEMVVAKARERALAALERYRGLPEADVFIASLATPAGEATPPPAQG